MYSETRLVYEERDKEGRIVYAVFSNGYRFERTYEKDYKNGTIPYSVVEYMNGKKVYEREGDTVLFGK